MSVQDKRNYIINQLRMSGCRITNQRKILIDVILQNECESCKEIYYRASREDSSIGMATVYRMVRKLEEANLIRRRNMYRVEVG